MPSRLAKSSCGPRARILVPLVVQGLLLIALVPLAHATPPDPLWIPGIYDEADHDDVVVVLVDEGLALANLSGTGDHPSDTKPGPLNLPAESFVIASAPSTLRLRSPPATDSLSV